MIQHHNHPGNVRAERVFGSPGWLFVHSLLRAPVRTWSDVCVCVCGSCLTGKARLAHGQTLVGDLRPACAAVRSLRLLDCCRDIKPAPSRTGLPPQQPHVHRVAKGLYCAAETPVGRSLSHTTRSCRPPGRSPASDYLSWELATPPSRARAHAWNLCCRDFCREPSLHSCLRTAHPCVKHRDVPESSRPSQITSCPRGTRGILAVGTCARQRHSHVGPRSPSLPSTQENPT